MCSGMGDRTCLLPGFPVRTPSDHSSVGSSPRLIAAPYVLLRLLVPRHPPCALINLATKMLASTVQFSRYGRPTDALPRTPIRRRTVIDVPDQRFDTAIRPALADRIDMP